MSKSSRTGGIEGGAIEKFSRAGWLILAGLTAVAVAMRFYRLGDLPAGLHYDEAFNGLDALSLLETPLTDWPVFFDGNSGREPLFIWLSGIAHALFGPSIRTARFVSTLSGALLLPALAWLGWQIAPWLGVRNRQLFALWCAAALLGLLWCQVFARYGIRATLFVLLETVLLAAMWRAWQQEPPARSAWTSSGILAGISLYSYLPARLLPLLLLLLLGAAWLQERRRLRRHLPGMFWGIVAALLVSAPLGVYFLQNPLAFSTRIGEVTTGVGLKEVFANLVDVLGMFLVSGDHNLVSNVPDRPVLGPFLALPFLIGLGMTLRRPWRLGRLFLLAGLCVLLLPTVLSDYAPNFFRAIGALPFTALLVAYGAEGFVGYAGLFQRGRLRRPAEALGWVTLCGAVALTTWTYFGVWPSSEAMFYGWSEGYSHMARRLSQDIETRVYVSPRDPAHPHAAALPHPSGEYLLAAQGITPQYHDERFCLRVALEDAARYFSLTGDTRRDRLRLDSYFPDSAPPRPVVFDDSGKPWATELRRDKDAPALFAEMRPMRVNLDDGIELNGYRLSPQELQAEQPLRVRLFWRVYQTPTQDYTLFLHLLLVDGEGLFTQLAGFDRPPGNGTCPMTEWLPAEMVVHEAEMNLPALLPPGDLFLAVGFYTPADGRRMPVSLAADDHILIGPLTRTP